ncbi:histidyl-tRNA synthetase [Thiohalorhabdus denitrificans]|uniref:Histidine--tRNA ligase n=2 Tax=Thiohalorhabdus denitrificans TaxID=381306 RepID=A0A1G5HDM1_9GAMM|nr:histidyl-tRNA synthetase [Thiohalorhabdus denitrificans]
MAEKIRPVRGMNDILPDEAAAWQHLETEARRVLEAYGYREIRFPHVERLELFARSIGEDTDIVEKEMYTFEDTGGEILALRPEGTAGCVRAGITNGLFRGQTHRLYYLGPMFRHERPQKGRYRQFHQVGVEAFGPATPDLDVEQILMARRLLQDLGVEGLTLHLNSLGKPADRRVYREELVGFLEARRDSLCETCQERIQRSPMRVLDCKVPTCQEAVAEAPEITDFLGEESRAHFDRLRALLDAAGVPYELNPRLVRGLDYYTDTVYEWTSDQLGSQATVVAGGRYDGLVEEIGGPSTPAVGFALGIERLLALVAPERVPEPHPSVFIAPLDAAVETDAMALAESLRDRGVSAWYHCGGGSLKSQLKKADRSGARLALVLGEQEQAEGTVLVRDLASGEQEALARREVEDHVVHRSS